MLENGKKDFIKFFKQKLDKTVIRKIYKFEKLKQLNPNLKSLKSKIEKEISENEMDNDYAEFRNENPYCNYFTYFDEKPATPAYLPKYDRFPKPNDGKKILIMLQILKYKFLKI